MYWVNSTVLQVDVPLRCFFCIGTGVKNPFEML